MAQWRLADFDNSPNFQDNAPNSMEQQAALQNAVGRAQELQGQGKGDQEIVMTLANEGVTQPEQVVQMMHLRQKKDFTAPQQADQDQQPAVSSQEAYPPEASDSTPDTSLYSRFVSYMTRRSYEGYDPELEDNAVNRMNADPHAQESGGWSYRAFKNTRQGLLDDGIPEEKVNRIINQLISETYEAGHEEGLNEYFGPEQHWPQGFGS
jgi:hypothetical protein